MNARARTAGTALILVSLGTAACARGANEAPPSSARSQPIAVGAVAPRFTLPSAHGANVSLADFIGKKPVLLYFSMGPG